MINSFTPRPRFGLREAPFDGNAGAGMHFACVNTDYGPGACKQTHGTTLGLAEVTLYGDLAMCGIQYSVPGK